MRIGAVEIRRLKRTVSIGDFGDKKDDRRFSISAASMAVEMDPEEISTDNPPPINQLKGPWVTVAKGKQVMKKYEFEISESEGKKSVEVPSEVIEKANPLWDDFVIARFLETAPHVAKVHMIVNKIWAYGERNQKLDVYVIGDHTMRIRIPNEKTRKKVVGRGMWNVAGVPMIVSHWSPEEDKSKAGLIPLWVHVTNVPMRMYSWESLSFITSAAGVPDHLHPETLACTNLDVAKVFVQADLTKEFPDKINCYSRERYYSAVHVSLVATEMYKVWKMGSL